MLRPKRAMGTKQIQCQRCVFAAFIPPTLAELSAILGLAAPTSVSARSRTLKCVQDKASLQFTEGRDVVKLSDLQTLVLAIPTTRATSLLLGSQPLHNRIGLQSRPCVLPS